MEEPNSLESKVQELMLEKDESVEHIEERSSKHEAELQKNDTWIEELQNRKRTGKKIK